jgi:bZIP transcription factor
MATMDSSEHGYFNIDHSIGKGSYESMFAIDPVLFDTSASISEDPSSHQDLDNILGGQFLDQLGSGSGMLTPGFSAWNTQGTAYSPYPDMSYTHALPIDQQQAGAGPGIGSLSSDFVQSFPESNGVEMQAVQLPHSVQIDGLQSPTGTKSDQTMVSAEPAAKRKSDAAADTTNGPLPKPKKKRGPRKSKQKTEEEKRAKEERKLERNRMAASKCRQKKKVATEQMMEKFNELERQNHWMKASLEEAKQERNKIIALLLEHKECNYPAIDKCLESQLARIADEFENPQPTDMFRMDDDTREFLNSNASSPSNESPNISRRNSMAMSSSGSNASLPESATVSHAPQSWPTAGYQTWQEQFGMSQRYQQQQISEPSKASHHHSPSSSSSTSMSRQNSSRTSVSEEHDDNQRNDSGISEMDTPPEERKEEPVGHS